jgi:hypothetical protein
MTIRDDPTFKPIRSYCALNLFRTTDHADYFHS